MRPAQIVAVGVLAACAQTSGAAAQPSTHAPRALAWVAPKPIKERDADRALRETLDLAANHATMRLARNGAFARSPSWRVPLPADLRSLRGGWNDVGRSGALDRLDAAMNRAAEESAGAAQPHLLAAVDRLDFADAVAIVRSGDQAASQLFALRSRAKLAEELRPIVEMNLTHAGAFIALNEAAVAADAPARAAGYRGHVIDATLSQVLDAVLTEMGSEERAIRAAPDGRGSALLREVFSAWPEASSGRTGG